MCTFTFVGSQKVSWVELDDIASLSSWQVQHHYEEVKREVDRLAGIRKQMCLSCGQPFREFDLHHAIVSRNDVKGWRYTVGRIGAPRVRLMLITNVLNCIPLHNDCNVNRPPTREDAWDYQYSYFGEALVMWYDSLPWKVPFRRFQ